MTYPNVAAIVPSRFVEPVPEGEATDVPVAVDKPEGGLRDVSGWVSHGFLLAAEGRDISPKVVLKIGVGKLQEPTFAMVLPQGVENAVAVHEAGTDEDRGAGANSHVALRTLRNRKRSIGTVS